MHRRAHYKRDEVYPLAKLPAESRERIALAVAQPKPPPKWLDLELARVPNRAWWEWHWHRGRHPGATITRRKIPNDLRQAIYDRDNHTCRHCGATANLTLDHIHPVSRGGADTADNLQTLCRSCNSRKGARI